MAYCSNCGSKLDDGTKFCPNCGSKVSVKSADTADNDESSAKEPTSLIGAFIQGWKEGGDDEFDEEKESGGGDSDQESSKKSGCWRNIIIAIVILAIIGFFSKQCKKSNDADESKDKTEQSDRLSTPKDDSNEEVQPSEQREEKRQITLSKEEIEKDGFETGARVATNDMNKLIQEMLQKPSMDEIESFVKADGERLFKAKYCEPSSNEEYELMNTFAENYYLGVMGVIGTGLTLYNSY